MQRLHRFKSIIMVCFFLLVLIIIPFVQKAIHGELRQLPMAGGNQGSVYTVGQMVEEYGYYPDDQWVGETCAFYIRTGEQGLIKLDIYYPFEITGNEIGHIFIDGIASKDYTLVARNTLIQLQTTPDETHYVTIVNDFYREPDQTDARKLSFVLNHIYAE